jgi:hypothetical protein
VYPRERLRKFCGRCASLKFMRGDAVWIAKCSIVLPGLMCERNRKLPMGGCRHAKRSQEASGDECPDVLRGSRAGTV